MAEFSASVQQWDFAEVALKGPSSGNPFVEVRLSARFSSGDRALDVTGFYDGDGIYRIRFMPTQQGHWQFQTSSNAKELDGKTGSIECIAPSKQNHGPVRVANTFHFEHADGTPFRQIGTTCYAWTHQGDELEQRTLATLKA